MLDNTADEAQQSRDGSPSASPSRLFDAEAALERLDGDAEIFAMLVAVFQEDSVDLFKELSTGARARDLPAIARAAHSIKGLAANFDAHATVQLAEAIEAAGHAGDAQGAAQQVEELGERLHQLRNALAAMESVVIRPSALPGHCSCSLRAWAGANRESSRSKR